MAVLIDGNKIAAEIKEEVRQEVAEIKVKRGVTVGLAVVLVGEDPASRIYVANKVKSCEAAGIYSEALRLPTETTQDQLLTEIDKLNRRDDIHGILVQSPPPPQINEKVIFERIDPEKDVDGFHPMNVGRLVINEEGFVPATPSGIIETLTRLKIPIEGKEAVVIGRSDIVGKPIAFLLLHRHATITICHSRTQNLPEVARRADILVAAVGRPAMVKGDWVKPGAVVIDVGINRITKDKAWGALYDDPKRAEDLNTKGTTLVGDVDEYTVGPVAGYLTPVPGGVGPLTIAMLLKNAVFAAKRRLRI
ncbi:MAG: bifunctional methylenetetrahydrofolate dehydrogenase/methenyltetrahydrofolate cyclohydrolase FolD [Actinobacteria bacterium]|nr:bifunctional methylenetetrahydrofolate dehydrogenase/methenyltetrahydrofolate cyclohydrolase FolD [Actinomycetota bacterium]